jgi:hypothetical protein
VARDSVSASRKDLSVAFASFHLVVGRDDYVLVKANCVSTVKMQKCLENARRLGD